MYTKRDSFIDFFFVLSPQISAKTSKAKPRDIIKTITCASTYIYVYNKSTRRTEFQRSASFGMMEYLLKDKKEKRECRGNNRSILLKLSRNFA